MTEYTLFVNEATKLKSSLSQCYFDIINKISCLEIPSDKENLLSMAIIEANKCSDTILERTELWFDTIKIKLSDVSNIISIDDLASNIGTPTGVAPGSGTTSESSGPPPVPPAVPPVPGGRFTPLTPGPGTLEWGCSPSALLTWFQSWEDFLRVNWLGSSPSEVQLLSLVKFNLSEE